MNDNTPQQPQPKQPAAQKPEARRPIPIEKLLFTSVQGIKLPDGPDGKNDRVTPFLVAGAQGVHADVKIEIDWQPWLHVYRVTKSKKITRTGKDGKEVVSYEPMGRPFTIPEGEAVAILADE